MTTKLTPREMLVMRLRAKGYPTKDVAARLGVAEQTVKNYQHRAFTKLGVSGVIEALGVLGWLRVPTDADYRRWLAEREREAHAARMARIEALADERDAVAVMRFLQPINPDPVTPLAKAMKP